MVVQWLRLHTFSARGVGSIHGQGIKIPHAAQCGQKKKKKEFKNNFGRHFSSLTAGFKVTDLL